MAYDTLTALCEPESFYPDPMLGWRPRAKSTWFDLDTGEIRHDHLWYWNDQGYDLTYHPPYKEHPGRLLAQVSIPRVLFNDNIQPWTPDPSEYTDQLEVIALQIARRVGQQEGVPHYLAWRVYRLDATCNYYLASEGQVAAVLRALYQRRVPRFKVAPYTGDRLSVMWRGKTRAYETYSKYLERMDLADTEGASRAQGILRAEARAIHCGGVRRVLKRPLGLEEGVWPTVGLVTTPEACSAASSAILGNFDLMICQTVGALAVTHDIRIADLVQELGLKGARDVIGGHYLWNTVGETGLRGLAKNPKEYYHFRRRLKNLGYDPAEVDLGNGRQPRLITDDLLQPNPQLDGEWRDGNN